MWHRYRVTTDGMPARNRRASLGPRVNVAGVDFDVVDLDEAEDRIVALARDGRRHQVVTANVDHLMLLRQNADFRDAYEFASLRVADGAPIVMLSRLIGDPLPARVTGSDLFQRVCARAEIEGLSVGFVGAREDTIPIAMEKLAVDYPKLRVAGAHCPPVGFEHDSDLTREAVVATDEMNADLTFVLLGAPKQENWWHANMRDIAPTVALHFGASLDFYAGTVNRAPRVWQRLGLEWAYRLIKEPRRMWRRYLVRDLGFLWVMARVTFQARLMPGSGRHRVLVRPKRRLRS